MQRSTRMTTNPLGALIAQRRAATVDPKTGRPYTQFGVTRELEKRGVNLGRGSLSHIEIGRTSYIDPGLVNAVSKFLRISVNDLCRAIGYEVEGPDLSDPERQILEMFRTMSETSQHALIGAAKGLLEVESAGDETATS